jgi:exopolysaccharide biosynthesis predicted pyruvyltransferase EpsI
MFPITHETQLKAIQSELYSSFDKAFGKAKTCVLLDFPNHGNVGDSAIWLGERHYLKERNIDVTYTASISAYASTKINDDHLAGPIVFHGGGNFGDLWLKHQQFRLDVIQRHPEHQIICLPQTLHFSDLALEKAHFKIINQHPRLTMFVRDRNSFEIFRRNSAHSVHLCPDSALFLNIPRPGNVTTDVVSLYRTDHETRGKAMNPTDSEDWTKDTFRPKRLLVPLLKHLVRDFGSPSLNDIEFLDEVANERLARGCRQISRGNIMVCDRLHAHILATIMGVPHVVMDNNYGKICSFRECWTKDLPLHRFCADHSQIPKAIEELRAEIKQLGVTHS